MYQEGGDTSYAAQTNRGFKAIFGPPVTTDGLRENPENGGKHQYASWQSEFAEHFQIVAVGVVHQKGEKSGLHGSEGHGKSTEARTKQRMLANQGEGVAPDGYPILAGATVFVSKGLKTLDGGVASPPKKHPGNAEEKQHRHCRAMCLGDGRTSGQSKHSHERRERGDNSHARRRADEREEH